MPLLVPHIESLCSAASYERISRNFRRLFLLSAKGGVATLFRGMVHNLQEETTHTQLLTLIECGCPPKGLVALSCSSQHLSAIKRQLQDICEREIGEIMLRLATEDSFDMLCDLASTHGRDLSLWGPPCACCFAHCIGCLESMVEGVAQTPPAVLPEKFVPDRPSEEQTSLLVDCVKDLYASGLVGPAWSPSAANYWRIPLRNSLKKLSDELWSMVSKVNPLDLSKIKSALDFVESVDGVDLYYAIAMRELQASHVAHLSDAPLCSHGKRRVLKDSQKPQALRGLYDMFMKHQSEVPASKISPCINRAGQANRFALARIVREMGNTAYSKEKYAAAIGHYTRAIGYDSTEFIFPLNRAACLLKLKRYTEAEKDCTKAIELSPNNHKAFFRRGVSRAKLGRLEAAKEDFEQVLELQKDNADSLEELRKLAKGFLDTAAEPQQESKDGDGGGVSNEAKVKLNDEGIGSSRDGPALPPDLLDTPDMAFTIEGEAFPLTELQALWAALTMGPPNAEVDEPVTPDKEPAAVAHNGSIDGVSAKDTRMSEAQDDDESSIPEVKTFDLPQESAVTGQDETKERASSSHGVFRCDRSASTNGHQVSAQTEPLVGDISPLSAKSKKNPATAANDTIPVKTGLKKTSIAKADAASTKSGKGVSSPEGGSAPLKTASKVNKGKQKAKVPPAPPNPVPPSSALAGSPSGSLAKDGDENCASDLQERKQGCSAISTNDTPLAGGTDQIAAEASGSTIPWRSSSAIPLPSTSVLATSSSGSLVPPVAKPPVPARLSPGQSFAKRLREARTKARAPESSPLPTPFIKDAKNSPLPVSSEVPVSKSPSTLEAEPARPPSIDSFTPPSTIPPQETNESDHDYVARTLLECMEQVYFAWIFLRLVKTRCELEEQAARKQRMVQRREKTAVCE